MYQDYERKPASVVKTLWFCWECQVSLHQECYYDYHRTGSSWYHSGGWIWNKQSEVLKTSVYLMAVLALGTSGIRWTFKTGTAASLKAAKTKGLQLVKWKLLPPTNLNLWISLVPVKVLFLTIIEHCEGVHVGFLFVVRVEKKPEACKSGPRARVPRQGDYSRPHQSQ